MKLRRSLRSEVKLRRSLGSEVKLRRSLGSEVKLRRSLGSEVKLRPGEAPPWKPPPGGSSSGKDSCWMSPAPPGGPGRGMGCTVAAVGGDARRRGCVGRTMKAGALEGFLEVEGSGGLRGRRTRVVPSGNPVLGRCMEWSAQKMAERRPFASVGGGLLCLLAAAC